MMIATGITLGQITLKLEVSGAGTEPISVGPSMTPHN
jgi:hypothetical protein